MMKNKHIFILVIVAFTITWTSCVQLSPLGLYDESTGQQDAKNINGFYQISIFKDDFGADVWFTKEPKCIQVENEKSVVYSGSGAIHVTWNKQAGGCPWMGMGFGWDGWTGKDFSQIIDSAAVSFWVRTEDKPMKALPWAIGFEDFVGNQQWRGVTDEVVVNGPIGKDWTQVKIPLKTFYFEKSPIDIYSIKQMMLQFESNGNVWIDNVELVPIS
ncbi:MAG: hypothetical protein R2809_02410 [Flavobacteriales bacterium]